jgi:ribose/xylose/arabinose/galactoside ABC-type transport system permease subunit
MFRDIGPLLATLGLALVAVGIVCWSGGLSWFGRLPGDIRLQGDNVRVHIPITSMLMVSAVASIVLSLLRR